MTNFPFFQHYAIKLIFTKEVEINEKFIDQIANLLINNLRLNVVKQEKDLLPDNGLTKFWILSQSHLVIHSWPENNALHFDLMTCRSTVITSKIIKDYLSPFPINDISVTELKY
jgi:S-adenosylmethionine/arginine decarboxylase-like enzyme